MDGREIVEAVAIVRTAFFGLRSVQKFFVKKREDVIPVYRLHPLTEEVNVIAADYVKRLAANRGNSIDETKEHRPQGTR